MTPERMTAEQAAKALGKTVGTLAKWRWLGTGPRYYQPNRKTIVYMKVDLDRWLQSGVKEPKNVSAKAKRSVVVPDFHWRARSRVADNRFGRRKLKSEASAGNS